MTSLSIKNLDPSIYERLSYELQWHMGYQWKKKSSKFYIWLSQHQK